MLILPGVGDQSSPACPGEGDASRGCSCSRAGLGSLGRARARAEERLRGPGLAPLCTAQSLGELGLCPGGSGSLDRARAELGTEPLG